MYQVVDLSEAPDQTHLGQRAFKGIGASLIPTIMGVNPYEKRSLDEVLEDYAYAIGGAGSPKMEAGIRMEVPVLEWWNEITGHQAVPWQEVLQSTRAPHLLATIDAKLNDTTHVEVKCTGYKWTKGLPIFVRYQVQSQLYVTGNERCHVVHWYWGAYPYDYIVEPDERLQMEIVERSAEAWEKIQKIRMSST